MIVPAEAVADKLTVPVPHLELGVFDVIVGIVFTVAETAVLEEETHPVNVFIVSA